MKLSLLNKEELTNLYKDEMMFDFPRAELKPLRAMLRSDEDMCLGQYDPLLVTDDQGVALGYAMIWLPRAPDMRPAGIPGRAPRQAQRRPGQPSSSPSGGAVRPIIRRGGGPHLGRPGGE